MFFEGAKRLVQSGVTIPGLLEGSPQSSRPARRALLRDVANGALVDDYGMTVAAPMDLADDPPADTLDALLCAIQAAWAWTQSRDRV